MLTKLYKIIYDNNVGNKGNNGTSGVKAANLKEEEAIGSIGERRLGFMKDA